MKQTATMVRDREIKGLGLVKAGAEINDPALARQLVSQGFAVWRQTKKDSAATKNRAPIKER